MHKRQVRRLGGVLVLILAALVLGTGCSDGSDDDGDASLSVAATVEALGREVDAKLESLQADYGPLDATVTTAAGFSAEDVYDALDDLEDEDFLPEGCEVRSAGKGSASQIDVEIPEVYMGSVTGYESQSNSVRRNAFIEGTMTMKFTLQAKKGYRSTYDGAHTISGSVKGTEFPPDSSFDVDGHFLPMDEAMLGLLSLGLVGEMPENKYQAIFLIGSSIEADEVETRHDTEYTEATFTDCALPGVDIVHSGTWVREKSTRGTTTTEHSVFSFTIAAGENAGKYLWVRNADASSPRRGNYGTLYRNGKTVR